MLGILFLSFGLAMDAVAVALVRGSVGERRSLRAVEVGLFFGAAQGLMPLIGWSLGVAFASAIAAFDHWIAFVLLGFLGSRMLIQAASRDGEAKVDAGRSHYLGLSAAAIATSIDAAAAGVTLPLLGQPVTTACFTIGALTAALCMAAYWLGTQAPQRYGKWAEAFGGIVLIGLGTSILIEHMSP